MIVPESSIRSLDPGADDEKLSGQESEVNVSDRNGTGESFLNNDGSVASPTPTSLASLSSDPAVTSSRSTKLALDSLHFIALQNATTCQGYTFSWIYDGDLPSKITLSITSSSSPLGQNHSATVAGSVQSFPLRTLSTSISSSVTSFTWESVDLVQGWYTIDARIADPGFSSISRSVPLYITNGTNTSCVRHSGPAYVVGRPHVGKGDIIGVIIGAIAAAGLLAVAFLFPRWWRRDLPSLKKRRPYYLY